MKVRFPLFYKILLWFFLNLVLIAGLIYWAVRSQFHVGLDSILAAHAGDRIQAVAEGIRAELNANQKQNWTGILEQYSQAYRARFVLVAGDGTWLAGDSLTLPPAVQEKARAINVGKGNPAPARRQPAGNSPEQQRPADEDLPAFDDGPPPGPDGMRPPPPPPDFPGGSRQGRLQGRPFMPGGPPEGAGIRPLGQEQGDAPPEAWRPVSPRILVHTNEPSRYWTIVHFPMAYEGNRPRPVSLIAMLDSLTVYGSATDFAIAIAVAGGVLVFSALFWLPLVRGITKGISKIVQATAQIAEGQFDVRVPEKRGDEIGALGQGINRMAERLAGLVSGQKRFLGDVAHELCTPIARTQMALGIMEQRADESQAAYLADLREEVQTMSSLVNELLSFSKASLGTAKIKLQSVHLVGVVERAVDRELLGAADIRINVSERYYVLGDPDLLLRSISNLIRNAIRYAGEAGPITIRAEHGPGFVKLILEDCGPGIPEAALAQVFDPFYRADPSRSRETGGVGLGMAIVKTCVESCSGTVSCRNRTPSGLEVTLTLKAALPPEGTV